ncbi:MAG: HhH-GPD family protein [Chloroflexota bacterium]
MAAGEIHALLLDWYARHGRDLPWRRTSDPYHILVSEVMLQQTRVERVVPKYEQWLRLFPTLGSLAGAPTADVIRAWAPLGYNSRAVRLQRIARQAMDRFEGHLPRDFDGLIGLDGIGPYTAGAVACFAHGDQRAFCDTNVRRVLNRLFVGVDGSRSDRELAALADRVLPQGRAYEWHQALMDLGATICRGGNPRCDVCPVVSQCAAHPTVLLEPRRVAERRVAERRAAYDARPFETTNRYFRGRVVDLLRIQPRTLPELAAEIGRNDPPWLAALLDGLQRDGLAVSDGEHISLP